MYYASDDEEKIFLSKVFDKYNATYMRGYTTFTNFLDMKKQYLIEKAFSANSDVAVKFYGGYEKAERKISAFFNNPCEEIEFPVKTLKIKVYNIKKLTHRDFLGSLMSLGIEREMIGDIVISDYAYVFVCEKIGDYILNNLTKIAGQGAEVSYYDGEALTPDVKEKTVHATVSSLRLDCVVGAGFNLSREKSSAIISSGNVMLNFSVCQNRDAKIKEEDVISVRGHGRIIVKRTGGLSKKGRNIIELSIPQ
ncbi:MAG: hypothetical protein IJC74_02745 [Clostridia bacterium]|nr:hypothetical protein [Clostridia bacterium]